MGEVLGVFSLKVKVPSIGIPFSERPMTEKTHWTNEDLPCNSYLALSW